MSTKSDDTVRYEVDLDNLPLLTEAQKTELAALSKLADDEIDYSDIPSLAEEQLAGFHRGHARRSDK